MFSDALAVLIQSVGGVSENLSTSAEFMLLSWVFSDASRLPALTLGHGQNGGGSQGILMYHFATGASQDFLSLKTVPVL